MRWAPAGIGRKVSPMRSGIPSPGHHEMWHGPPRPANPINHVLRGPRTTTSTSSEASTAYQCVAKGAPLCFTSQDPKSSFKVRVCICLREESRSPDGFYFTSGSVAQRLRAAMRTGWEEFVDDRVFATNRVMRCRFFSWQDTSGHVNGNRKQPPSSPGWLVQR
jgi:hypothetical protein